MRYRILSLAVLLAIMVALWVHKQAPDPGQGGDPGPQMSGLEAGSDAELADSGRDSGRGDDEHALLRLLVIDRTGAQGTLSVSYMTRALPGQLGQSLWVAPNSRQANPWLAAALGGKSYTIPVPRGDWTWVGVAKSGKSGCIRYFRFMPIKGDRQRTCKLVKGKPTVHVFIDCPGRELLAWNQRKVRIYHKSLKDPGRPSLRAEVLTDRRGYLAYGGFPGGLGFVCVAGARLHESAPHVGRFVMQPGRDEDTVVRVVPHPPTGTVVVEVTAAAQPPWWAQPVLFLERVDLPTAKNVPVISGVRRGKNPKARVEVPAGRYRLNALPLGVFGESLPNRLITVFPGRQVRVPCVLAVPSRRATLRIQGVPRKCWPFSVLLRDPSALDVSKAAISVVGPFSWRSSSSEITVSGNSGFLEVRARGAWYLSKERVDLSLPEDRPVEVQPASVIHLIATRSDVCSAKSLVASVDSSLGQEKVRMVRNLQQTEGGIQRYLTGIFLVPKGRCSIALVDSERSRVLYEKTILAGIAPSRVLIE